MQEHESSKQHTVSTTGRGYNRHVTDVEHEATGAATDLYSPVPSDDDGTRPGMVGSWPTSPTSSRYDERSRLTNAPTSTHQQWTEPTRSRTPSTFTQRSETRHADGGIMQKIQDNPLAVVAAATAGGMLVGRLMRNRSHRHDEGYLRNASSYGYQGYQAPRSYQQPSYRSYQGSSGYQGYQGYQMPSGFQGGPQYRADQEFRPEQGFQGRHENFPGGSNWD